MTAKACSQDTEIKLSFNEREFFVARAGFRMRTRAFKLTVCFETRSDGGLRAWSDDVPGLVLSHSDADSVLADVPAALSVILSHQWDTETDVKPLRLTAGFQEYVATRC